MLPGPGGILDQDPYWMALVDEYRHYRWAFRIWSQGSKGVERILKMPERERDAVVDALLKMRRSQGLPMDEADVLVDMRSNDPDESDE